MENVVTNQEQSPLNELEQARRYAAEIPEKELQRETLAQLYLQNERLKIMKGHMVFYTIMQILFVFAFLYFYQQMSAVKSELFGH